MGTVKQIVQVRPGTNVSFRGPADQQRRRLSGRIDGEITVAPKSIFMGKLPQELIESRTVNGRSNSMKPFQITNLNYDSNLLKFNAQPLPDKSGCKLEVSVNLANVPSGNSTGTAITFQTDLDPQAKEEIQVRLVNQAD